MNASGGERAQEGEGTASILLPRNDPNQVAGLQSRAIQIMRRETRWKGGDHTRGRRGEREGAA